MSLFDRMETSGSENQEMWNSISEVNDFHSILEHSEERYQLIYKHSHRCSVAFLAKEELEEAGDEIKESADLHMVDVVNQRNISNTIASQLNVRHESPQVIILKDREVIWNGSHYDVKGKNILDRLVGNSK